MKVQIERFLPHQNAKVFAVLFAVSSLVFVVPFFIIMWATMPAEADGPVPWFFLFAPVMYLVLGYITMVVGCALYNFLFRYVGGIEYIAKATDEQRP